MQARKNRRFSILPAALMLQAALVFLFIGCQGQEESEPPAKEPKGFSFLNMGADTPFSDGLRNRLKKTLGADAFSRKTTVDLEIYTPGFLKQHFAKLHELNEALNRPRGERTEHDTLKLAYRYAKRAGAPFEFVELVFSNHTKLPLYFRIQPGEDYQPIIDQLREKYGEPGIIEFGGKDSRSLFWNYKKDVMIASIPRNRYGDLECRIMIYFVESLETMIQREEGIARKREEEKRKAGKTAF